MARKPKKMYVNQNSSNDDLREALSRVGVIASNAWDRSALIYNCERQGIWHQLRKSVVKDSFKTRYGPTQNCGDDVAALLLENDLDEVKEANGIDMSRWKKLNPGMQRMNLGNVLRGRIKRGEYVVIGGNEYNKEAKVA